MALLALHVRPGVLRVRSRAGAVRSSRLWSTAQGKQGRTLPLCLSPAGQLAAPTHPARPHLNTSSGPSPLLYPSKTPSFPRASDPSGRCNHRKIELRIQNISSAMSFFPGAQASGTKAEPWGLSQGCLPQHGPKQTQRDPEQKEHT